MHVRKSEKDCPWCAARWGITSENRGFIPDFHKTWDPSTRTWIQWNTYDGICAVRQIDQYHNNHITCCPDLPDLAGYRNAPRNAHHHNLQEIDAPHPTAAALDDLDNWAMQWDHP